ncbi:coiled-coil domain-containing protein 115 [Lepeophtheirus salmonis]|uniref:coiled-coil domain-containing protein 115 n=1 Tax=Lepeophtheirus salmonis TaxID=72036 RepID=UPI001AE9B543|nr:coiled-coil domain-containing protein 115-like [Lepeophtheirus salmonis]
MNEQEINDELDSLYMKITELSQDLIDQKLLLEKLMMNGFNGFARARYNLGTPESVSSLNIPSTEFPALVKIDRTECLRTENNVRFNYFNMCQNDIQTNSDFKSEEGSSLNFLGKTSNLRNRSLIDIQEKKYQVVSKKFDPLLWFGILVPRCLKDSQSSFKKANDYIIEIANIQNEIQGIIARQKYLNRTKTNKLKEEIAM